MGDSSWARRGTKLKLEPRPISKTKVRKKIKQIFLCLRRRRKLILLIPESSGNRGSLTFQKKPYKSGIAARKIAQRKKKKKPNLSIIPSPIKGTTRRGNIKPVDTTPMA
ncbi:hypothetical protein ES705_49872 [subsurface metagenome]